MEMLLKRIHRANAYERELFGAVRLSFNAHLDRWHSHVRPEQMNNNFFVPTGVVCVADIDDAIALQKQRGLNYLMLRSLAPLDEDLRRTYGFVLEMTDIMVLLRDESSRWPRNPAITIRDIQTEDIGGDLLDVSAVPERYRAQAYQNMLMVLEVAKTHPDYHWYCAYQDGERVANVYALCHGGCIEMDDLWVKAAHRGQYIATTLMAHVIGSLPGIPYLHADRLGSVHEMYQKMGFETVETVYDYVLEW